MNPLVRDRDVDFLLDDVLDLTSLLRLRHFADHDRETVALFLASARRLAREVLFPAYRPMDAEPPRFDCGRITVHPRMKALYAQLVENGYVTMTRPESVGGQQMPMTIASALCLPLDAANIAVMCYAGLTTGAAHLIESFGSDELKNTYMKPMYEGRYTGTMALTEPNAGSSLADVRTRATPTSKGHYLIQGEKVFISGGDNTFSATRLSSG